ncbi:MAG: hypothetical protein KJ062_16745 [Thermoanaerobaculia bacterium]|nr:hypothetical protein [Thermoanaerobaculia bacterium]
MNRPWRALCALLLLSVDASASWVVTPPESLIDHSDLVLVGTLTEACFTLRGDTVVANGTLRIESTLTVPDSTGSNVSVHWSNSVGVVCPRLEHQQHLGLRSLWFLKRVGDRYEAATDGSVVPLTGGGAHTSLVLQLRKVQAPSPLVRRVLLLADEELVRLQPGLAAPR